MSGDDSSDYYYYNWMKNLCDQVSGGALGQYRFVESLLDLKPGFGNVILLWQTSQPDGKHIETCSLFRDNVAR